MAYDEGLAQRVRELVTVRPGVAERKMFGGIGWMIGGHLACGVIRDDLFVRHDRSETDALLSEPHAGPFGSPGRRPMSGFVLVTGEGVATDADLARWVDRGADFAASLPPK